MKNIINNHETGILRRVVIGAIALVLSSPAIKAETNFVWQGSASPTPPYTSWPTAAHTIQDAVDASTDGNVVLVTNGTYYPASEVRMTNAAIAVRSVNGPDVTIVSGNNSHRVFWVRQFCVLDGFTVTNGRITDLDGGAGVKLELGVVTNCVVVGNSAPYAAGVFIGQAGTVDCCTISGNVSSNAGAGALLAGGGTLRNCTISGNAVVAAGHQTNLFYGGGGVMAFQGGIIENCIVSDNASSNRAGGVYIVGTGTVERCEIRGNTSLLGGGGVLCDNGGFLQSCLIISNVAPEGGGVLCVTNGTVQNCTIVDNAATTGGGVFCSEGGGAVNSIIHFNTATLWSNYYTLSTNAYFMYCCTVPRVPPPFDGGGNITNDPDFVDYAGGDYHLNPTSPCVDAGTNMPGIHQLLDLDGKPRVFSGTVDMGAYEIGPPAPVVVITSATAVVHYDIDTCTPAGTNNSYIVGGMWVSNALNNSVLNFPAASGWTTPPVALDVGANDLYVCGTNADAFVACDMVTIVRTPAPRPVVTITSVSQSVNYDITSFAVAGTNNAHVDGGMYVSNALNGAVSDFPAAQSWTAPSLPLNIGTNDLYVFGTNRYDLVTNDSVAIIRLGPGTGAPFVDITNQNSTVLYDVDTCMISGTNNINVVGAMWVTNAANGDWLSFYSTSADWFSVEISLAIGTNDVLVFATNVYGHVTNDTTQIIRHGPGTGDPYVDVLSTNSSFTYDVASFSVAGTNNMQVVGGMWVSNTLTGTVLDFPAVTPWLSPAVPLVQGENTLYVYGTNAFGETSNDKVRVMRGPPGSGTPIVVITNTVISVPNSVTNYVVAGTNNANVVGGMRVKNWINGDEHDFPASASWVAPAVLLDVGVNDIYVHGTNTAGDSASDFIVVERLSPATGPPFVNITNTELSVTYDVSEYCVAGTNNFNVTGWMTVSNAQTGEAEIFPAQPGWTAPPLSILAGANHMTVFGANGDGITTNDSVVVTRGAPGTGLPFVDVTNIDQFVKYNITSFSVGGTNGPNVLPGGGMWVSNALNGIVMTFAAADEWSAPALPLDLGTNAISVYGTNVYGTVTNDTVVIVRDLAGTGPPYIDITTTPTCVTADVAEYDVSGTNNANVVGTVWLVNAANGATNTCAASDAWTITGILLAFGTNDLTVHGTNFFSQTTTDSLQIVRGIDGTGTPFVDCLTTAATVSFDVHTFAVYGTNNVNVVGGMGISNAANGAAADFPASQMWFSAEVALDVGANLLCVFGTNYENQTAGDSVTITRGEPGTGTPEVTITSTLAFVDYDVTTYTVAGTNNPNVVGGMWVSNTANGEVQSFVAAAGWVAPAIGLAPEENLILVFGTNAYGAISSDSLTVTRTTTPGMTNYVSKAGSHAWPFITWATASTTIHAAVETAVAGNVVLVDTDTFLISSTVEVDEDILFKSRAGADATLIIMQPGLAARCFHMSAGIMDGFTVTNNGSTGGGAYIGATCTVRNSVFIGCSVDDLGGAILCDGGGVVSNCTFRKNAAQVDGGAVFCNSGGLIVDCDFVDNSATNGGAVTVFHEGVVSNCSFIGNIAHDAGGSVYLVNGGHLRHSTLTDGLAMYGSAVCCEYQGTIDSCLINGNIALVRAAVYCNFGGLVTHSRILDNYGSYGGGVFLYKGGTARNCLIADNTALKGGGAYLYDAGSVENCTICNNTAVDAGGGAYVHEPETLLLAEDIVLLNSIIYNNVAAVDTNSHNYNSTAATFSHCCTMPLAPGAGNIATNPLLARIHAGFYRPTAGSPCVNAGTNFAWMDAGTDLMGKPRIVHILVDIGAYEFTNAPIIWLDPPSIDFGDVVVDETAVATIIVGNAGTEILSGQVLAVSLPFALLRGSPYSLAPGAEAEVEFALTPTEEAYYSTTVELVGGGNATLPLEGTGIPEPVLFVISYLLFIICHFRARVVSSKVN